MKIKNLKPLKLAFIGGGINSSIGKIHYLASQLDKKFEIVAGCFSTKPSINIKTAKEWNINLSHTHNDIDKLINLEKNNVDAFVLLLPTPDHYKVLKKLIIEDLNVICEKPIVSNIIEAKKIEKLIKKLNYKKLYVTYNYTGYGMVREIKKIIENKKLGKLLHFVFEMPQDGFLLKNKINKIKKWRMSDLNIPTIFLDLGIHLYSLSSFLFNASPVKIIGNASSYNFKNSKIIDNVSVLLKYNYFTGNFWFSKSSLGNRNSLSLRIYFEEGAIMWSQKNSDELKISINDGTTKVYDRSCRLLEGSKKRYNRYTAGHPSGFLESFSNMYSDIAFNLQNNKLSTDYIFDYKQAIEGIYFLDILNQSIKKNKWLQLNLK